MLLIAEGVMVNDPECKGSGSRDKLGNCGWVNLIRLLLHRP